MDAAARNPAEQRLLVRAIERHRPPLATVYNNQSNNFGINFKRSSGREQRRSEYRWRKVTYFRISPASGSTPGGNHLNFRDGSGNTKPCVADAPSGDGPASRTECQSVVKRHQFYRRSGTYGISISATPSIWQSSGRRSTNLPLIWEPQQQPQLGSIDTCIRRHQSQNNINAESATRSSANTTLSASIGRNIRRVLGVITGESEQRITRAAAGRGQADLVKPVQLNNRSGNGSVMLSMGWSLNRINPLDSRCLSAATLAAAAMAADQRRCRLDAADHTYRSAIRS
jgi:hypothetical protein